jgi:TonB family protein
MCLILTDVLTFLYFYWSTTNVLQNYACPEYIAKLVAVLYAGFVGCIANYIVLNMFKRKPKRWVPALVGAMAAWFVIMSVVASPYESRTYNIFTGQPGKYYRDQYGHINLLPPGARVGEHGEPALTFTPETSQEFQRQSGDKKKTSSLSPSRWDRLFGSNPSQDTGLQMQIEKLELLPSRTILHFAVRRADNSRLGRFYRPHGWNYLSDETGQTYDLTQDNATYPDWVDSKSHKPWVDDDSSGKIAETKVVRQDETYRFTDEYPPLKPDGRQLRLHDSRFAQVDLDYQLSQARAQAEIQKRTELEQRARADPQNNATQNELLELYLASKLYDQAISFFSSVLENDPKNINASCHLGIAYFRNNQDDKALAQVSYSLTLNPRSTAELFNQGIYRAYGKKDLAGAEESWQKVLFLDPDGKDGRDAKRELEKFKLKQTPRPVPTPPVPTVTPLQAQNPAVVVPTPLPESVRAAQTPSIIFTPQSLGTSSTNSAPTVLTVQDGAPPQAGEVSFPEILYQPGPYYTQKAWTANLRGKVLLYVQIDPLGHTKNIRVARGLGMGLDENAIEAVSKWRFRPAYKDGRPVTIEAQIEVEF